VNRQPRTLGLKELIRCYIDHRVDVIRRRTQHLLREAKKRAHVLEGMIYAVTDIDEVIKLIRSSKTRDEAIEKLMSRRYRIAPDHPAYGQLPARLTARLVKAEALGGVALTRVQAEVIGSMRLIQLVGLEIQRLIKEYNEVTASIEDFEDILASPARINGMIIDDCDEMKARYGAGYGKGGVGDRRTRIEEAAGDIDIESLIREEDMVVTISRGGYVKRVAASTYEAQGRGGKGIRGADARSGEDVVTSLFVASTHDALLAFTDTGRVFKLKVYELPEASRTSRGRAFQNFLQLKPGEKTTAYLAVSDFESGSKTLTFVSRAGIIKRTPLKAYANVNKSGLIAVGLKEGDALYDVLLTGGTDDIILITDGGMAIRFNESDARDMGRSAAGVKGIDLKDGQRVIGAVPVPMQADADGDLMTSQEAIDAGLGLLTLTENGYGKRTDVDEYRVQPEEGKPRSQSRGGKGRTDIRINSKNGKPVVALGVHNSDDVVFVSANGQLVRIAANTISRYGRGTQGVRVVSIKAGDSLVAAARVVEDDEAETEDAGGGGGEA
jgi:DNA gyrase subunit A